MSASLMREQVYDAGDGKDPGKPERLSVNLHADVARALRWLAKRNATTITEAVRRAISDEVYLQQAVDDGAKILIRDRDGQTRELVFR